MATFFYADATYNECKTDVENSPSEDDLANGKLEVSV
jgi:hypothetical protein